MASVTLFMPILLSNEGGWAHTPGDNGGETWEGIAYNYYPKWPGWAIVFQLKQASGFPAENWTTAQVSALNELLRGNAELKALVSQFYKVSEWDLLKGDEIVNQSIANFLVDWEINCGEGSPLYAVQDLAGISPHVLNMGPRTLGWLNANSNVDTFVKLQAARSQHYRNIAAANPADKKFLGTWLSRTSSFKFAA
jgi:lysozyme family protein